jgi:Protein of unknown function (DUF3800)
MSTVYLFGDEAGNFDFSGGPGASRYFILTTVTMSNCQAGDRLQALRRRLAWQGVHLGAVLHATEDPQSVRDAVFQTLARCAMRIDTTILSKRSIPATMRDAHNVYRHVWHEHFARIASDIAGPDDRLLAVASGLGTRKRRGAFHLAVDEAVRASARCTHRVAFWPNMSEPCLVVADYCTWAIQRKWERNDNRSLALLQDKIASEAEIDLSKNE